MQLDDVQRAAQEQFGRQSQRYGTGHILQNVEDVRHALAKILLPRGSKALDVATGAGHTGLFLAQQGFDVVLTDIAQPMLDRAAQTAAERGLSIKTAQHPAEKLPYENESFDLVICRVAAHHFSSPQRFVAEAARVLKTGGFFIVIDGTVMDDNSEAEEWAHSVEKLRDPSHNRFITPNAWKELCEKNHLSVQELKLVPFKQPDLNWYFETAATSQENRRKVLDLIEHAPESARTLFRLGEEAGKIIWWWQRMTLIAKK
jgi:ubiquinone/menaquinone biosynthesis C-methylase UbiE